jgi:hypothetical protein
MMLLLHLGCRSSILGADVLIVHSFLGFVYVSLSSSFLNSFYACCDELMMFGLWIQGQHQFGLFDF